MFNFTSSFCSFYKELHYIDVQQKKTENEPIESKRTLSYLRIAVNIVSLSIIFGIVAFIKTVHSYLAAKKVEVIKRVETPSSDEKEASSCDEKETPSSDEKETPSSDGKEKIPSVEKRDLLTNKGKGIETELFKAIEYHIHGQKNKLINSTNFPNENIQAQFAISLYNYKKGFDGAIKRGEYASEEFMKTYIFLRDEHKKDIEATFEFEERIDTVQLIRNDLEKMEKEFLQNITRILSSN